MQHQVFLIKPASAHCNMRCAYCFYANVTDIRSVKNRGMMTETTAERLIQRAFREVTGSCTFAFQGGEPTLIGLDFYRRFVEMTALYNTRRIPVYYALQTNGLLLDGQWGDFFRENHFLIGLSIDGSKAVHDALRVDANGQATHRRCGAALALLRERQVDVNVLTVVSSRVAADAQGWWQFVKRERVASVQLIPCLDELGQERGGAAFSLRPDAYGAFLCAVFDLWFRDLEQGHYVSVRIFDNLIRMLRGEPPENCAMNGVCHAYPVVEADGSVYPCDFYALDEFCLGNLHEADFSSMLSGERARAFVRPSRRRHEDCESCPFLALCRGGCRRDRESAVTGVLDRNYFCESYRTFFAYATPRLRYIAQNPNSFFRARKSRSADS